MHRHREPARALLLGALCLSAAAPAARAQCPDGTPPPCAGARARGAAPERGSIAVLPFANRSPDTADAYLADEFPEQITGRLSRIPQLHVTSATAVAAQWRRTPDALASARALHVEWLVTGTLRRARSQITASVELVRTATGEQAWSSLMRRGDGDIGAIEVMVAESVAVAAAGRLAPGQAAALTRRDSRNPEAYRLYLYAKALMARRTIEDIGMAVRSLEEAVHIEPRFAGAWARLSQGHGLQTQYGSPEGLPVDSLMALSRREADRALALDSASAEAWLALGQWMVLQNRVGESWQALQRAVALDSLDANIEHAIGYIYSEDFLDLPDHAAPHFRRALQLNPDLRNDWRLLGLAAAADGRLPEAIADLDSALALGPWLLGYYERSWLRFENGDVAGAVADRAKADSLGSVPTSTVVVDDPALRGEILRLASGDSAEALADMARAGSDPATVLSRAYIAMALGRHNAALDALETLQRLPDPNEPLCGPGLTCSTSLRTWRVLHAALFRPLRGDPRYERLLEMTRPTVPWLETGSAR